MNALKKYLGILWMVLSPAIIVFLFWQAADKIGKASEATQANVILQWTIILIIFLPICIGLFIFGKYAFNGYYEHLPESSAEITDY
jgi:ABC-type polysaccharide/polyol phosphate export permease